MLWYGGSVAEAVTLSKQRNAIFVVFIEGDNELSVEMAATIAEPEIVKRLADPAHFLAIKLLSGSPNYTHFAQIYQFVPVPSLFFIGRNGTPLEVVCAGVQAANLADRIDRILEEHQKDKPIEPSTSGLDVKEPSAEKLSSETNPGQSSSSYAKGDKMDKPTKKQNEAKEPAPGPPPAKLQKTEFVEVTRSGKEYEVVCEGDVCRRVPKSADGAGPSTASVVVAEKVAEFTEPKSLTADAPAPAPAAAAAAPAAAPAQPAEAVDERVEKAKELIEAKRREKAAKEKELEKQKELERRALGQGVNELKKWQSEQELKQIQDERKREKMENNLARQRILEQIALDRAERKARDQPPPAAPAHGPAPASAAPRSDMDHQLEQYRSERRTQLQLTAPPPPVTHTTPHRDTVNLTQPATPGDTSATARIQFKLPDGTSHTAHFEAEGALAVVHTYVSDNLQLTHSHFSLWTAFPRRELTDPHATLRSLQLTPSAALLVLPRRQASAVSQPTQLDVLITFITQMFTQYVLDPTRSIYAWLQSRLFPPTSGRSPSTRRSSTPEPRATPTVGPSNPPGVRHRGNIHRLGENQQDDDNNTWNGNSTQQM